MKLITKLLATAALMSGTAGVFAYPDRPIQLIILNPAVTHSLPADFAAPKTADVG